MIGYDDNMYIMGVDNVTNRLSPILKYNPLEDKWKMLPGIVRGNYLTVTK